MTIGIGTDIVQIPRIEKLIAKYKNSFAEKILCPMEMEQYDIIPESKKSSFLAKRFAAKEAIAKAFGTGIGSLIKFHDILISNDVSGKPLVKVTASIAINKNILLSLSDDYPIAVAFVLIS